MKIDLYDVDEFVKLNNLKEVTSGVLFQRGGVPHPDGLLSNEIFGITVKSRRETFAYIDLHEHFFHPHIYKLIKRMFANIDKIINGEEFYSLNDEGILVVDRENGETGIDFLYRNWNKITWKKNEGSDAAGSIRNERVGLLEKCKKNEIFISKLPVIPVFYRDVTSTSGGGKTGDLNKYYANLIRVTTLLRDREMFGFQFHATNYNIQQCLLTIYDYFKGKVEKKNGMIRKFLMGKTVDRCVRTVITAPNYHAERPSDMMVDYYHCGIPISQICSLAYEFMMHWLKNFFEREIISKELEKVVYDPEEKSAVKFLQLDNPASYFDEKYIKNMMDTYIRDPSSRFNKIEVPVKNNTTGKPFYLRLTGRLLTDKAESASIIYRPMTVTDLLYMAAVDVTKDKKALITRYPITDEFSIIINNIRVNSTTKVMPMMVNGHVYKWYPVIDFNVRPNMIGAKFIDSTQFANSFLKGIGGDYDGDQCTVRILFSQEANEECEKYIHTIGFFINAAGQLIRTMESEVTQTFYTMTKEYKNGKPLTADETKYLLDLNVEDYTFTMMSQMLGTTKNMVDGKDSVPKFGLGDKLTIPKNYFSNKEEISTTVGRFVFYKNIFASSKLTDVVPFVNNVVTQKVCGSLEAMIVTAAKEGLIDTETMETYINIRDWFGLQMHSVVCNSFTPGILFLPKEIEDEKKRIIKENRAGIESGDPVVGEKIEKALISKAQEILKDDPAMDLYMSGARGSFGNNFKNINLIRGPVFNEATGKYDFIDNSLMDGLQKKDFAAHANVLINGSYPKSVGTSESGYLGKQLNAIMQSEVLDPDENSDCGTKFLLDITLPVKNIHEYDYRFIQESGKLVCLYPEIIEKYRGKTVKMRSVMMCKGTTNVHCKCSRCAGLYYYRVGKYAIGLQSGKMATTLTNLNMKKFHENLVRTVKIDPTELLI